MNRGVRGATTVENNKSEDIINATKSLLVDMVNQNEIKPEHIVSVFISMTPDLNADFPAKALRMLSGWTYVPVICMQEIPVPHGLPLCIRILMTINSSKHQNEMIHSYHNKAKQLRPDLMSRVEEE